MGTGKVGTAFKHVQTVIAMGNDAEPVAEQQLQENHLEGQEGELRDDHIPDAGTTENLPKAQGNASFPAQTKGPKVIRSVGALGLNLFIREQLTFESTLYKMDFAVAAVVEPIVEIDPVRRKRYSYQHIHGRPAILFRTLT